MIKVSIVVAGMVALLRKSDDKEAAAVLLGHPHDHVPILLVHNSAKAFDGLATLPAEEVRHLLPSKNVNLPDLSEYNGYKPDGINLSLEGVRLEPQGIEPVSSSRPPSGCPGGDWSSLTWLVSVNDAHKVGQFSRTSSGDVTKDADVKALLSGRAGRLSGHPPIEKTRNTWTYEYLKAPVQAYTDAFLWEVSSSATVDLVAAARKDGQEVGRLTLTEDTQIYLLHLPDPDHESGTDHFALAKPLPYSVPANGVNPKRITLCGAVETSQTIPSPPQGGGFADELSVTIVSRGAGASGMKVSLEIQAGRSRDVESFAPVSEHFHATSEREQFGDSLCMARHLVVDDI